MKKHFLCSKAFIVMPNSHKKTPTSFCRFETGTGHYSQLVWAESRFVGCGHITFPASAGFRRLLVCNYGPAGNFVGEPVYVRARPCSMCPVDTACPGRGEEEDRGGDNLQGLCIHKGDGRCQGFVELKALPFWC